MATLPEDTAAVLGHYGEVVCPSCGGERCLFLGMETKYQPAVGEEVVLLLRFRCTKTCRSEFTWQLEALADRTVVLVT